MAKQLNDAVESFTSAIHLDPHLKQTYVDRAHPPGGARLRDDVGEHELSALGMKVSGAQTARDARMRAPFDFAQDRQDAFAADYQEDEYALLGKAIKYAGLRGKEIRVIGKNRKTLQEDETVH
jgi:hypothetical protein